ncbi:MAG: hypothetical protein LBS29_01685 [Endomicrobium sp.]|nr:hypothetical protein [Endomicrobium sp.]
MLIKLLIWYDSIQFLDNLNVSYSEENKNFTNILMSKGFTKNESYDMVYITQKSIIMLGLYSSMEGIWYMHKWTNKFKLWHIFSDKIVLSSRSARHS